jgi:hypothetical protein
MAESAILFFNWWGILFLLTFCLGYGASHIFLVKGLSSFDFASKLIAFIALILIFVLSGWKAGLVALPIGFVISGMGAILAGYLRADI